MEDMKVIIVGETQEHLNLELPQMTAEELEELKQVITDWVGHRPTDR